MDPRTQTEAMFPARLTAWRAAREFLERFCTNASLARAPGLRLSLVLEELFTNTVNHGHRGDCDFLIWISLSTGENEIAVTYLDQGPPFNPLAMAKAQLDVPLEDREIGGLGVHLTTELTTASDYAYVYGRNRLRLVLPCPG
ncbi:MAG: ATP-binding protein [Burkholderiales bacterium]|nr:ATP-binding protein [Burkholderiales bacterium]